MACLETDLRRHVLPRVWWRKGKQRAGQNAALFVCCCTPSHRTGKHVRFGVIKASIGTLQVNDPESAIRDTTAVIEAVENGAVSEKKKQRELLERATYRCVNAARCM